MPRVQLQALAQHKTGILEVSGEHPLSCNGIKGIRGIEHQEQAQGNRCRPKWLNGPASQPAAGKAPPDRPAQSDANDTANQTTGGIRYQVNHFSGSRR